MLSGELVTTRAIIATRSSSEMPDGNAGPTAVDRKNPLRICGTYFILYGMYKQLARAVKYCLLASVNAFVKLTYIFFEVYRHAYANDIELQLSMHILLKKAATPMELAELITYPRLSTTGNCTV